MSWRRATLYWACFLGLGLYYLIGERPPGRESVRSARRAAFLNISAAEVQLVEARHDTETVRCRRVDGRWKVEQPAGAAVPSDLVAGLISNLADLKDVEVVAERPSDLAQFGLDAPAFRLTLTPAAGPPITLRLGGSNPSGTAVYAQHGDRVYLVGLNSRYYAELLFDNARGKGR